MLQRTLSHGFVLAAILAGAPLPPSAAHAADLDYNYGEPPPETKVQFGSGWYIRGDIAATRLEEARPSAVSFDTTNPATIPVPPGLGFSSGSDIGYTATLGAGYQFNRWFRSDLVFDFHQPVRSSYTGGALLCPGGFNALGVLQAEGCSPHYAGGLNQYDVLINGYIDLGTWYSVTPYIGAGVGVAFGHYSSSVTFTQSDGTPYNVYPTDPTTGARYHEDFDAAQSGTFYNFAFALMAGVSIDVYDHTKLDIGYRYLNNGRLPNSASGSMYENEVRAGLRYMIDN